MHNLNIYIYLTLTIILNNNVHSQHYSETIIKKNQIRSAEVVYFDAKTKKSHLQEKIYFDSLGRIANSQFFNENKAICNTEHLSYAGNGEITKKIISYNCSRNSTEKQVLYTNYYDEDGDLIDANYSKYQVVVERDSLNRIIKKSKKRKSYTKIEVSKYGENGLISELRESNDTNSIKMIRFFYNSKNQLTEKEIKNRDPHYFYKFEEFKLKYFYNAKGLIEKQVCETITNNSIRVLYSHTYSYFN